MENVKSLYYTLEFLAVAAASYIYKKESGELYGVCCRDA